MSEPTKDDDPYAANYMKGAGRVILRDKVVSRSLAGLLGFFVLWCGGGAIATFLGLLPKSSVGVGFFLLLMASFFAFLTMTLTVARTMVSEGEVRLQYGLWGPRIPVGSIRRCRVVAYDWKRFGGWGIKRSGDGTWAYVLSGTGDVVELTWMAEDGEEKTVQFSASDPRAFVAAVDEARGATTGVRIAADVPAEATESAEESADEVSQSSEPEKPRRRARRAATARGSQARCRRRGRLPRRVT